MPLKVDEPPKGWLHRIGDVQAPVSRELAPEAAVGWLLCDQAREGAPGDWVVMAAEIELYKSGSQYRWRLQAASNEVVASGEAYTTKAAALKGIDAVKRAAAAAEVNDKTGE